MKIEELKTISDRKFYSYIKKMNYNNLSEEDKKQTDYINKVKAGSLTAYLCSGLAILTTIANNGVTNSEFDAVEAFGAIGVISATVYFLVNFLTFKDSYNKNDILIMKRVLENLKEKDLEDLINKFKGVNTSSDSVAVKYLYDRLKELKMIDILGEIETTNNTKYKDADNALEYSKHRKNN